MKQWLYGGTALWCLRAQASLNLENRDLDRRNLRSMLKISCAACPCLSQLVSAHFAHEKCLASKIAKKSMKPLFKRSRSSKVIEISGSREPVHDFLLKNSNLGPISHRYWDTATYWPKIAHFALPISISALVRSDPLQIYRKALRFLKLESSRQQTVKNLVILACTVFDWSTRVTDVRTDGQNCDG